MERESERVGCDLRDICDFREERPTGESGVLRTLWNLYFEGVRKARIVENDRVAQKHYRKLFDTGGPVDPVSGRQMPSPGSIVE